MKFLLFDFLLYLFGGLTYSSSFFITYQVIKNFWGQNTGLNSVLVFIGFVLFVHIFVIILSLLKWVFQPRLVVGDFPIGMNKDYFAWALNSAFCGIYLTSPFAQFGHLLFTVNWLFYRGMGMKVGFNSLIGLNTTIRQPELITVGQGSVLGLGCILSCHFTADGKIHTQKPIKVGSKTVIGGYSALSPGVTVGDRSVVGAESRVFPDVTIGDDVKMGAFCYIDHGCVIPNNVRLKSYTRIRKTDEIKSNEIWEGNPAKKIGDIQ